MTEPRWYSPSEYAGLRGVHVNTVWRWLKTGALRGEKIGGLWFIAAATWRAWLASKDGTLEERVLRAERLRMSRIEGFYCDMQPRPVIRSEWLRDHSWSVARTAAVLAAGGDDAPCARCGTVIGWDCEVNHIIPRNGGGYDQGCAHHQSNLEVLCHDCHVRETARQRADRLALVG